MEHHGHYQEVDAESGAGRHVEVLGSRFPLRCKTGKRAEAVKRSTEEMRMQRMRLKSEEVVGNRCTAEEPHQKRSQTVRLSSSLFVRSMKGTRRFRDENEIRDETTWSCHQSLPSEKPVSARKLPNCTLITAPLQGSLCRNSLAPLLQFEAPAEESFKYPDG